MRFKSVLFKLVLLLICCSCESPESVRTEVQIIPAPQKVEIKSGRFILSGDTFLKSDEELTAAAKFLGEFIRKGAGISLNDEPGGKIIHFSYDETIGSPEAYKIKISRDSLNVYASHGKGALHAVQTLRQMMPVSVESNEFMEKSISIPCVEIEDEPRFDYRGMHLDVGRHFFSVEFIKKYIDALALLKFNTFHWHLTEEQGWRVEIKAFPKLNEIASFRKETLVGHYNDSPQKFDGKRYGGYYSREEIKEIAEYAGNKYITVIPEIEMPGHSQAVIAAYPELGCTGEEVEVATKWGVFEDIYCSKEETFEFLEQVLDEVLELFPGEYIHIGGDEAPKSNWKACDACQKRISEEGLNDEHELQAYFIKRIEKYLNSKGRQIIGWDEILEGGLAPNATVMSWRGVQGAVEAAKMGHRVIMTPTSHCYFDYYQSESESEPLAIGGFLPLRKVYEFNPIPEELNQAEASNVWGGQANVWTEYMKEPEQVEYMIFPRILAMSEVLWSDPELRDYDEFVGRVENFHERLKKMDYNYADHLHEISTRMEMSPGAGKLYLETESNSAEVRFTTDNTTPDPGSKVYRRPISIERNTTVKAAVFDDKGNIKSSFTEEIKFHKAFGYEATLNVDPHPSYNSGGVAALTNGIYGSSKRYGDNEWLGFWGDDLKIKIDLGKKTPVDSISMRFYNANGQWIYAPELVSIKIDDAEIPFRIENSNERIIGITIPISLETQQLEINVPSFGIIPDNKQGAGNPAWTFIDEIIVN